MVVEEGMSDNETKQTLYVQTHGEDDPARAAIPFYLASTAAAMDIEVGIYFTMSNYSASG